MTACGAGQYAGSLFCSSVECSILRTCLPKGIRDVRAHSRGRRQARTDYDPDRMPQRPLEGFRSPGFQPATSSSSIRAGKMPARQRTSRYFFSNLLKVKSSRSRERLPEELITLQSLAPMPIHLKFS